MLSYEDKLAIFFLVNSKKERLSELARQLVPVDYIGDRVPYQGMYDLHNLDKWEEMKALYYYKLIEVYEPLLAVETLLLSA